MARDRLCEHCRGVIEDGQGIDSMIDFCREECREEFIHERRVKALATDTPDVEEE